MTCSNCGGETSDDLRQVHITIEGKDLCQRCFIVGDDRPIVDRCYCACHDATRSAICNPDGLTCCVGKEGDPSEVERLRQENAALRKKLSEYRKHYPRDRFDELKRSVAREQALTVAVATERDSALTALARVVTALLLDGSMTSGGAPIPLMQRALRAEGICADELDRWHTVDGVRWALRP